MTDPKAIAATLSEAQKRAMLANRTRGESSYSMRVGMGTLKALYNRNLVRRVGGAGSMFSPETAIEWPLTSLGLAVRKALQEQSR